MNEARCEGCGITPQVHGSSWCARCHDALPEYTKNRMIAMRNALLLNAGFGLPKHPSKTIQMMRERARNALAYPIQRQSTDAAKEDQ